MPDGCWASPLAAAGKIYLFCKNGTSLVMEASALEPKVIAENAIPVNEGDKVYGYAVSENKFILRTGTAITCIGK